jgi:hypothetical protein
MHTFEVQTPEGQKFQIHAVDLNDATKQVQTYIDKNRSKLPETASIDGEPDHNEFRDAQFWLLKVLAPPISAAMALLCVGWILGGFQSKSRAS